MTIDCVIALAVVVARFLWFLMLITQAYPLHIAPYIVYSNCILSYCTVSYILSVNWDKCGSLGGGSGASAICSVDNYNGHFEFHLHKPFKVSNFELHTAL